MKSPLTYLQVKSYIDTNVNNIEYQKHNDDSEQYNIKIKQKCFFFIGKSPLGNYNASIQHEGNIQDLDNAKKIFDHIKTKFSGSEDIQNLDKSFIDTLNDD